MTHWINTTLVTHWLSDDKASYLPGSLWDTDRGWIKGTRKEGRSQLAFLQHRKKRSPHLQFQKAGAARFVDITSAILWKSGTHTGYMTCLRSNRDEEPKLEPTALILFSPPLPASPCRSAPPWRSVFRAPEFQSYLRASFWKHKHQMLTMLVTPFFFSHENLLPCGLWRKLTSNLGDVVVINREQRLLR